MNWRQWQQDKHFPLGLMALMGALSLMYVAHIIMSVQISAPALLLSPMKQVAVLQKPMTVTHLFGVYDNNADNVPITRLALSLQGVMLTPHDAANSYAIISMPGAPSKVYKTGAPLLDGATLSRIREHDVLIQYQGQLQRLLLPRQALP